MTGIVWPDSKLSAGSGATNKKALGKINIVNGRFSISKHIPIQNLPNLPQNSAISPKTNINKMKLTPPDPKVNPEVNKESGI